MSKISGGGRGILGKLMAGAVNGLFVTGGEVATGFIAGFVPLAPTGVTGVLVRVAGAYGAGLLFGFLSPRAGAFAMAGGFSAIWRSLAQELNVTTVNNALATASAPLGLMPSAKPAGSTAGFPALPGGRIAGFPGLPGGMADSMGSGMGM